MTPYTHEDAIAEAEHFVQMCREEMARHPRSSPVVVTKQTAKDIDMSGIWRMTPEQIDEELAA
jgi:hypothetical protein